MDGNAYAASVGSGVMNVTKPLKVKEVKHRMKVVGWMHYISSIYNEHMRIYFFYF